MNDDEMREEYDFSGGVRGKYKALLAGGARLPDGTVLAASDLRRMRFGRFHPRRGGAMGGVFKSIEMVGASETSFDDAVRGAVRRAGETMRNLEWMEVVEQRGYIAGGDIREYQVKVKIWFKLDAGQQDS